MRLTRIVLLSLFLFAFFVLCISRTTAGNSHSIMGRLQEITALQEEYIKHLTLLRQYSKRRIWYFEKGLGWKGSGSYGFDTGNHSVYFSDIYVGMNEYSDEGALIKQFSINYETETLWVNYGTMYNGELDKPRIGIGYHDNKPVNIVIVLGDGTEYTYWETGYRVMYPGGAEYSYSLIYYRDEPALMLSPELENSVFYTNKGPDIGSIINDMLTDFPYPYFSRIVKSALDNGINIKNEKVLVLYTINWFRNLLNLSPLQLDKKLDKAAENHAEYVIRNQIARNMLKWDPGKINLNDYLELHSEKKGMPGFTGVHPADRTEYTGFGPAAGECATIGRYDVINDELAFFHSIFHRRPFLDPRVYAVGHGHGVDNKDISITAGITKWGYDYDAESPEFYLYPVDGEQYVPVAWTAVEAPDPFPGNTHGMGPPISVAFTLPLYKNGNLELFDSKGKKVQCLTSKALSSPDNFIEVIPEYPLEAGSKYTIVFSYPKNNRRLSKNTTFTTAPLNPAETAVNTLIKEVTGPVELRDREFDINEAMEINNRKGTCELVKTGNKTGLYNKKYDFFFFIPRDWKMEKRDWQEVLLKKSWYSINIYIGRLGQRRSLDNIYRDYAKNITYKEIKKEKKRTEFLESYRVEYSWKHDNSVIIYYGRYNDYACIIYGYGALDEEMKTVFESFREGKP